MQRLDPFSKVFSSKSIFHLYDNYGALESWIGRQRQLPNPENCSLTGLELAIDCSPDRKAQNRLRAIHVMLCGGPFELTQKHSRVSEKCLQFRISGFNERGIDGLAYRPKAKEGLQAPKSTLPFTGMPSFPASMLAYSISGLRRGMRALASKLR